MVGLRKWLVAVGVASWIKVPCVCPSPQTPTSAPLCVFFTFRSARPVSSSAQVIRNRRRQLCDTASSRPCATKGAVRRQDVNNLGFSWLIERRQINLPSMIYKVYRHNLILRWNFQCFALWRDTLSGGLNLPQDIDTLSVSAFFLSQCVAFSPPPPPHQHNRELR